MITSRPTLNPEQQTAIDSSGQPILIIAGAGSGKTMVITHKVIHLIESKVYPANQILAITFTNKAAKEMKARILSQLPATGEVPFINTFHGLCGYILRRDFHHLGRDPNFVICDRSDQIDCVKSVLKSLKIDPKTTSPNQVLSSISMIKNDFILPEAFAQMESHALYDPQLAIVYQRYQAELIRQNAIDFDDMLIQATVLLQRHPEVLASYQRQFQYIIVDEYQDTNQCQYMLTQLLVGARPSICVVGDFDQNIYSWRGANVQNILRFEADFPNTKKIVLEQNYRSTQTILKAANSVIANNKQRKEKNLWTDNAVGDLIQYYLAQDERVEARYIVNQITAFTKASQSLDDVAILVRTNAQSRVIEEALITNQIGYHIVGSVRFYGRKEVKDIISYLRLIHNPNDSTAFMRAISAPSRGIGAVSVGKIIQAATAHQCPIPEIMTHPDLAISAKQRDALARFFDIIFTGQDMLATQSATALPEVIRMVMDRSGYQAMLEADRTPDAQDRLDNLSELVTIAQESEDNLAEFLNQIALMSDLDELDDKEPAVTIMTYHHAKGLEFPLVILAGFEEGLLPHYRSQNDVSSTEEERRLCYVGITRGQQRVVLTSAHKRLLFGETWQNDPSRFLFEIDPSLVAVGACDSLVRRQESVLSQFDPRVYTIQSQRMESRPSSSVTPSRDQAMVQSLTCGDEVTHEKWGLGIVNQVSGTGDRQMATIQFGAQSQTVMVKYAPLVKV